MFGCLKNLWYLVAMNLAQETNNQQPSILRNKDEGSETIPKGSTLEIVEAASTLTDNAEGKEIVQGNTAFINYVNKCNQKFNNKFDYSEFTYKSAKSKSVIICPIHGKFINNLDKHVNSKYGCQDCWNDKRVGIKQNFIKKKEITTFEAFYIIAEKIYKDRYSYDKDSWQGLTRKTTIICNVHGKFITTPTNFLKAKVGCNKCARESARKIMTDSYDDFLEQSNKIHNNKYEYLDCNREIYKNKKSIIKIKCHEHGIFNKKAQKHISGQGCFKCKVKQLIEDDILVGGYSENLFNNNPELKTRKAKIYLLKINDYYKVGITTKNIKNRIKGLISKAKKSNEILNIELLKFKDDHLYNCFILEQRILRENNKERLFKSWSTELLKNVDFDKYF